MMLEACLYGEEILALRDCGLAKSAGQIVRLFALDNMRLSHKRLLPLLGEVPP